MAAKRSVTRSTFLTAPALRVWRAVTDPAQLSRWLAPAVELDVRAGGTGSAGVGEDARRILVEEVVPGVRLAFVWWDELDAGPPSRVELVLEPDDGATWLTVTETALADLDEGAFAGDGDGVLEEARR